MRIVRRWLGERLPVSGRQFRELTTEPVPYHLKRWWFALGGTPAYLFIVQIFTGILLAFYYEASPVTAYESVEFITREVSFGWYIRSVHKWAATLMIVAVILHQIRVFFTGAYRKPREINWMVGMCLLLCTNLDLGPSCTIDTFRILKKQVHASAPWVAVTPGWNIPRVLLCVG